MACSYTFNCLDANAHAESSRVAPSCLVAATWVEDIAREENGLQLDDPSEGWAECKRVHFLKLRFVIK